MNASLGINDERLGGRPCQELMQQQFTVMLGHEPRHWIAGVGFVQCTPADHGDVLPAQLSDANRNF